MVSVPVLHHLSRVDRPVPSAKHPLAGLWKGHCGRHGVQLMVVTYDFSGPAARIVATKACRKPALRPTAPVCKLAAVVVALDECLQSLPSAHQSSWQACD